MDIEKKSSKIMLEPIGVIRTPFKKPSGMPIQPTGAEGVKGSIILEKGLEQGLCDLDGFSHLILLYNFHMSEGFKLKVKPFLDDTKRGLFATRAPKRPNQVGLSVVKLIRINKNILEIEDADMLDGTPLIDIKPYIPEFDARTGCSIGWFKKNEKKSFSMKSDSRFSGV